MKYLDRDLSQTISFQEFVDAVMPAKSTQFYPIKPVSYIHMQQVPY